MLSDKTTFSLYLAFLIPSILCSIFVLYQLLFDKTLRQSLHNHVVIILLLLGFISQLTNYPWMVYYYQHVGVWERSWIFCAIWGFLDWPFYLTQSILFAWTTIERHILIFHEQWLSTKIKRFFMHYFPLIVLLLYCFIFYMIVYFFPPCENLYSSSPLICIQPCYFDSYKLFMWETVVHQLLPALVIIFFSLTLLIRVVHQKYRMHRSIHWRRHRKMAIQVLSISFLYLVFFLPYVIVTVLHIIGYTSDSYFEFLPYSMFFSYLIILFLPFVCALSLPKLLTRLIRVFRFRQIARRVHPIEHVM